jgi:hypothetical protein
VSSEPGTGHNAYENKNRVEQATLLPLFCLLRDGLRPLWLMFEFFYRNGGNGDTFTVLSDRAWYRHEFRN